MNILKRTEIAALKATPLLARIFRILELERKNRAGAISRRESLILGELRYVSQDFVNTLIQRNLSAYEYRHLYLFHTHILLHGKVADKRLPFAFIRTLDLLNIEVTLAHKLVLCETRKYKKSTHAIKP